MGKGRSKGERLSGLLALSVALVRMKALPYWSLLPSARVLSIAEQHLLTAVLTNLFRNYRNLGNYITPSDHLFISRQLRPKNSVCLSLRRSSPFEFQVQLPSFSLHIRLSILSILSMTRTMCFVRSFNTMICVQPTALWASEFDENSLVMTFCWWLFDENFCESCQMKCHRNLKRSSIMLTHLWSPDCFKD